MWIFAAEQSLRGELSFERNGLMSTLGKTFSHSLAIARAGVMKFFGSPVQQTVGVRAMLALCAVLLALPASAEPLTATDEAGLNLGSDADYAFIDLGSGTTLGWNSGPIAGSVLVGNGVTVSTSGGNNGGLTNGGVLYYDSTTICSPSPCGSGLQTPPPTSLVSTSVTSAALNTAQMVSSFASSLTPTQTFTTITSATTITGVAGLNVINVGSIQNAALILSGPANAFFVINVTGSIQTNQSMTLSGGLLASNVLWNLTGTSGNILQTSGGDVLVGTFLATDGGQFQFSELQLNGELIDTDGNVQFVSGSQIGTAEGFTVPSPSPTPLPGTLLLMATALSGGFAFLRKCRARGRTALAAA